MRDPGGSERARILVAELVGLALEERSARLAEACGDDEELRREVEALLEGEAARAVEIPPGLQRALSDRYRLRREIGRGGMATVYRADDLKHERRVALKVLRPELATAVGPERFLREIGVTARLDHPHIVPLLDSGEAAGRLYYVMPYVEGESLRDRLRREKQLPLQDALRITTEAADALSYAHGLGIVHRDVKPENILLSAGHARVVDFGIARALTTAGVEGLTGTGVSVGTPIYMSPEQASGEEVDARTDVYGLGVVAYEMLAGEPPYTGPTSAALLAKKLLDPVPSVRTVRDTVPAPVDKALQRALARLPADRFQSCSAFAEALKRAGPGTAAGGSAAGAVGAKRGLRWPGAAGARLPARRRRWFAWTGFGALALLAGLLLVQPWQGTRGDGQSSAGALGDPFELTPNRIAVFPFTVQAGPELEYLGEALMDLVSEAMDGLGDLRRVDPFAIMSRLRREGDAENVEPEIAPQLAAALGAGRYVLGGLMELEGELRITGTLYDLGEGADPAATATVRGRREELSGLVEELVRSLLAGVPLGGGARLGQVAAVQAANHEAFRAYLVGEALLRRGAFDSAGVKLRQAVEADSTFALAWYRLSLVQGWGAAGSPSESIERAMELRERLAPRDRMLVEAQHAILFGNGAEAERLGRRIVGSYPDHVEGWFTLADARRLYRWQLGIPMEEVASAAGRALELDPGYPWAVVAALRMAWLQRKHTDVAVLLQRYPGGGGAGPLRTAAKVTLAFTLGDDEARRAVTREIETATDWTVWNVGFRLAVSTDSLAAARRFWLSLRDGPNRSENGRALAAVDLARLEVARGRFETAGAEYGRARSMTPTVALADHAWRVSLPFFRRPRAQLEALRDSLQGWEVRPDSVVNLHATARIPGELLPWVKQYVLGLLSARLGEHDVALGYARALEDADDPPDTVGLRSDLALEIRALAALKEGRPEDALLLLEQCGMAIAVLGDRMVRLYRRPLARFLRAHALALLGWDDEALIWYQTLEDETWATEYALLAPVYLRQAEILERRGETADALQRYTWFLARWKDADPEYTSLMEDVRGRVERLSALRP